MSKPTSYTLKAGVAGGEEEAGLKMTLKAGLLLDTDID